MLYFCKKKIMISKPYPRFSPEARMLDLLNRNPSLLLLLEHFGMDFTVGDQTVELLCSSSGIDQAAFIAVGNLYNGYFPTREDLEGVRDISSIILCLKNSHNYYKNDKYPELKEYLLLLHQKHQSHDIVLLEKFFQDYFQEVLDHLAYEEEVAFPYFFSLVDNSNFPSGNHYRVSDYREHHSDIETKLADLKNLLLKHIKIEGDYELRRRFLINLYSLEADLEIHSLIEEQILLPLVEEIEKGEIRG